MSLKRVVETARRTGLPVIVTDTDGLEPLVILPLEQFEAMAGEAGGAAHQPAKPRVEPVQRGNAVPPEVKKAVAQAAAEIAAERQEVKVVKKSDGIVVRDDTFPADLSPEEQFLFEPLEDKGST